MAPLLVSLSGRMGAVITEDKSGLLGQERKSLGDELMLNEARKFKGDSRCGFGKQGCPVS